MAKEIKKFRKNLERHRQKLKYRTFIKNQKKNISSSSDFEKKKAFFSSLQSVLDKSVRKGIIHINRAKKIKNKYSSFISKNI